MKALIFGGPGQRSWESTADPGISEPTDVIVKVDTTTICGTDLHILKGDVPAVTEGRVLGHEAVGTVVETGAAVSSLKKGDRVLVPAITSCGRCGPCKARDGGPLRGGRRDRLDLRPPDRRRAGRVRARALRRDVGPRRARGRVRRAGAVPRRHPPDGLRDRRAERPRRPGRHGRGRRRGAGRPRGDDDRRDRRREPDHRGRPRRVAAQARRELRRDAHGRRAARTPRREIVEITGGEGVDVAMEAVGIPATFDLCTRIVQRGRHRRQHRRARRADDAAPRGALDQEHHDHDGPRQRLDRSRRCCSSRATGGSRPRSSAPTASRSTTSWRPTTSSPRPTRTTR